MSAKTDGPRRLGRPHAPGASEVQELTWNVHRVHRWRAKAFLLVLMTACVHVPAIGEACKAGDAYCLNVTTSLACRDGKLSPFACTGPQGCFVGQERQVSCDQSRNAAASEACFPGYEGRGQCAADGNVLQCLRGAWVKTACPTGTTCQLDGGDLLCR